VPNKLPAVCGIRLMECRTHPFGVPLYAEDGFCCVLQSFNDAVGSLLRDSKAVSNPSAALMMGAVDAAGAAIELIQEGTGSSVRRMRLILPVILMEKTGGKILNDVSAEIDIYNLNSSADAQNRFPGPDKVIQQRKLCVIQRRVHVP